jgi:putative ABC transport system ATP-binding protein
VLHLLGGMDRPDDGTVEADGTALTSRQLDAHRRRVGFVFQRFHLLPALTVLDNVLAPVLPRRVDFDRRERATELLEAVGLADRADALPSELSGGQQQRVAISRALINRPGLLLADEPTGSLDSATGREIIDLLLSLRERYGMTMLVATHDPEVAANCDRIVRLHDGRIAGDERVAPAPDVLNRLGGLRP